MLRSGSPRQQKAKERLTGAVAKAAAPRGEAEHGLQPQRIDEMLMPKKPTMPNDIAPTTKLRFT